MKILITGGTGFIGSHLVKRLIDDHHSVFILHRSSSSLDRLSDCIESITLLPYTAFTDFEEIFARHRFDGIIHLATKYIKHHESVSDVEEMQKSNILFPSLLLEWAVKHGCSFFINTGTCFEYSLSDKKITEKDSKEAYNYYASTKLAFEEILKYYVDKKRIKGITLKLFYPYGEKDNPKLMNLLISSLLNVKQISISKGEQRLNYTYVSDLVSAYVATLQYLPANNYSYEDFNIGSEESVTIQQIVATLEKISGKNDLISLENEYSKDEIMYMECDNTKAKKALRWQPQMSIEEGLRKMYNYYSKRK